MTPNRIAPPAPLSPGLDSLLDALVERFRLEAARVAGSLPCPRNSVGGGALVKAFLERLAAGCPRAARRLRHRMAVPLRGRGPSPAPPFEGVDLQAPSDLGQVDLAAVYANRLSGLRRLAPVFRNRPGGPAREEEPWPCLPLFPTVNVPVRVPPIHGLRVKLVGVRRLGPDARALGARAFGYGSDGRMHLSRALALGPVADQHCSFHPHRPLHYFVFMPPGSRRPEVYTVSISLSAGDARELARLERRVIKRLLRELRAVLHAAAGLPAAGPLGPWSCLMGAAAGELFLRTLALTRSWARVGSLGHATLQLTVQDRSGGWPDGGDLLSPVRLESLHESEASPEVAWRAEMV